MKLSSESNSSSRRNVIKTMLLLPAFGLTRAFLSVQEASAQLNSRRESTDNCKNVIAYFTRSGNTRVVAEQLERDLPADIFQIEPASPYPSDYEENVEIARLEKESQTQRPLKARIPNFHKYNTIFLGFPIWGGTAPAIIRTFLQEHDFAGKTIVPFITHGKYGIGNSLSVIRNNAAKAAVLNGYSEECDQERDTMERVKDWLEELPKCPE